MKEEYRDARGLPRLETLPRNIRFAWRVLWKNPGFAAPAGIGMAIGLPAAYGLARVLEGLLFGVRASDAGMFGLAVVAITPAAALASWSAARRAAAIDPVATLREE